MPSTRACDLPLPKKSLQIKQDDKFFSKLLSKETSMTNNNSSFRVYYGGVSGSVPFTWESQPGTPKHHAFSETTLPPLTPPPSYYSKFDKNAMKNNHSRSNLLHYLFLKLNLRKSRHVQPSPSLSLLSCSSWSSSYSSMSVPGTPLMTRKRRRFSSFGSSFSSKINDDGEGHIVVSPTSTLCFGAGGREKYSGCLKARGSSPALFVKKAWLSVVGHGYGSN